MHRASVKWDAADHAALLQASILSYHRWRSDEECMRLRWNAIRVHKDENGSCNMANKPNDYTNICLCNNCVPPSESRLPGLPPQHYPPRPECVRALST